jgi:hypothetical protein
MRTAIIAALALVVAACDGGAKLTSPDGRVLVGVPGPGGGNSANASSALVGTWQRTIFLLQADGSAASTETVWQFAGDGTGARTVTARNFSAGVFDTFLTNVTWQATATTVRVTFLPPQSGTVDYSWFVRGDTLLLAGQDYVRVR